MIFKRMEYIDDVNTGKIKGICGIIDEKSITEIFIPASAKVNYSWTVMIDNMCIRDIEDSYDGTYMFLYFDSDILPKDVNQIIVQLTLMADIDKRKENIKRCFKEMGICIDDDHVNTIADDLNVFVVQDYCKIHHEEGLSEMGNIYVLDMEDPDDIYLRDLLKKI